MQLHEEWLQMLPFIYIFLIVIFSLKPKKQSETTKS